MKQKAEPGPPSLFKKMKIKINKNSFKAEQRVHEGRKLPFERNPWG